ncbi:MAG TPA: cobalamin-dependent protein [Steroidobacteraceae bacterium]
MQPRVLITKIGLDGHDRGSRIVAAYLRDGGMEVIYTPPWQSIAAVVNLALQEDVDVIGVSSLASDHLIVPDLISGLRNAGLEHVMVTVGGIIPAGDREMLTACGVREIFEPGALRDDIVARVKRLAEEARSRKEQFWK